MFQDILLSDEELGRTADDSDWVSQVVNYTVLVLHVQYSQYRQAKYSFVVKMGVGKFNYFFYVASRKPAKSSPGPLGPPPLACIPWLRKKDGGLEEYNLFNIIIRQFLLNGLIFLLCLYQDIPLQS